MVSKLVFQAFIAIVMLILTVCSALVASCQAKLSADNVKFCVTSQEEMNKCETFTNIDCILGTDGIDCVTKINNNEADITSLDGGTIYLAGKCHNMKPIICECTGEMSVGTGYYAVAVAKKSSDVTLKTLRGVKSCHTGVNKTSGWYVPMSILFTNKSNQIGQASEFFEESCVPGAEPGSNLCRLCTPNCNRNSENTYYGYSGAALCLQQTDADVAFVKHLTFLSNPNKTDYKLLCKDGSTDIIDNYEQCHLAKVPAHAIVAKNGMTQARINEIFDKLHETPTTTLFSKSFGKNKIFSSSTTLLRTTYKTYTDYLTSNYINALPKKVC